jgi:hypothetical protein
MSRIWHYSVGANLFAQKPDGQIYRANKFAPTDCDVSPNQIGLNGETVMLAVKIQKSFEELEV